MMENRGHFVEHATLSRDLWKKTITIARNRNLENGFPHFSLTWAVYINKSRKLAPGLRAVDNNKLYNGFYNFIENQDAFNNIKPINLGSAISLWQKTFCWSRLELSIVQ